jgi:vitamin B12 transporter
VKTSVRLLSFLSPFVLLIIFSTLHDVSAQAQTPATLTGILTDPQGASVAGAEVRVESIPAAGAAAQAKSEADGRFSLTLGPGRYRVTVTRESFARVEQDVTLAAGETRELRIQLSLEPLSASVLVTAQAIPLDASSAPAPVDILTRADIDRRGAASLPDLLATRPGFSLGRTGPEGGSTSLFLDGGNSNYTKVLVDGAPANEPGGLLDFSNFTLDNIEKIEVVHGAESALYGSDAMDGVIQIFTHRGTTRIPELTAFGEEGNFSTGRGGAELSGVLGRFDYSAGLSDLETQGQGPNDAFRNRTVSGNFGWRFTDSARVNLALRDNGSDAGTPGPTVLQPPNLANSITLHNLSANLHAEFTTGPRWHHQLSGTEYYFRQHNINPVFSTLYQFNRSSFAAQSTYLIHGFGVTAGYVYEVENGFIDFIGMHERRNNQAGFLDLRWQPLARLTLSAGARAEDNANFGTRVTPRAGIAYALRVARGAFGDTRLRASFGRGIVEPRFDQSFGSSPCFPGNPTLSPEQSRTIHAGVEQKLGSDHLRLTADYFDNRFHNIISFQEDTPSSACLATGATFAGSFFNTNLARARGANLAGEARLTRWLSASANYTYDSTRTLSAPNTFDPNYIPGRLLLRRPLNAGNIMLNAAFRQMNWNLSGYFTGRRDDYPVHGLTVNPGYARLDLAGTYNFVRGFSLYGRIANLADKKYQDVLGFPALGREFRLGVKYTTRRE